MFVERKTFALLSFSPPLFAATIVIEEAAAAHLQATNGNSNVIDNLLHSADGNVRFVIRSNSLQFISLHCSDCRIFLSVRCQQDD